MLPQISVVIPVYNPGSSIDACIESLLGQSLRPDQFEVIFVDDGSTDATPGRLELLAAEHPHLRVVTIPNSGWPGKPRNVGTDLAQGEYVMYVDQDDALEPLSLEHMYEVGAANEADVVLGKVISDFRGVHHELYRVQRPRCDVFTGNLLNSLTPHKMLRTAFLRESGIRFPEGPRRLEDQLFMTRAYFAAKSASIVADYVCYRYLRRPDGGNAGSKRIDPRGYYGNLREVLDAVDAGTEPGEQRNHFYRRFLRTEMLGRLGGPRLAEAPPDYLTSLHHEVRTLLDERFPVAVDEGLGTTLRARAALVRSGTIHEIAEQAAAVASLRATARLLGVRQLGGERFEVTVEARMLLGERPVRLAQSPLGWMLPTELTGARATDEQRLVEPVAEMGGDLVVRHRLLRDEWFVPGRLQARVDVVGEQAEVVWSGTATVHPATAAGGSPLRPGPQDFQVRISAFGVTKSKRLSADRPSDAAPLPLLVDRKRQLLRVYRTERGDLSVNVGARSRWLAETLAGARFVETSSGEVLLDLGVVWSLPPKRATLVLTSPDSGASVEWPLRPRSRRSTRWLATPCPERLLLRTGRYRAELRLSGRPEAVPLQEEFVLDASRRRQWVRHYLGVVPRRALRAIRRVRARALPTSEPRRS